MKNLLTILCLVQATSLWANRNPIHEVYNLHYLFKKYTPSGNFMEVRGSYSNSGSVETASAAGKKFKVPLKEFNRAQRLGKSVLEASRSISYEDYRGTAYAVGDNYILTNFHVYSPELKTGVSCSGFKVNLGFGERTSFSCQKKIKCNVKLDYCLIKMAPSRKKHKWKKITDFVPAMIIHPAEYLGQDLQSKFMAIGNGGGHGIQASQGRVIAPAKRDPKTRLALTVYHYATVVKGNSGGPLIDHKNRVIGIITSQTRLGSTSKKKGYYSGKGAVNKATTTYAILKDLKKDSSIKKNILPFLNIR